MNLLSRDGLHQQACGAQGQGQLLLPVTEHNLWAGTVSCQCPWQGWVWTGLGTACHKYRVSQQVHHSLSVLAWRAVPEERESQPPFRSVPCRASLGAEIWGAGSPTHLPVGDSEVDARAIQGAFPLGRVQLCKEGTRRQEFPSSHCLCSAERDPPTG